MDAEADPESTPPEARSKDAVRFQRGRGVKVVVGPGRDLHRRRIFGPGAAQEDHHKQPFFIKGMGPVGIHHGEGAVLSRCSRVLRVSLALESEPSNWLQTQLQLHEGEAICGGHRCLPQSPCCISELSKDSKGH
eukprot:27392_2